MWTAIAAALAIAVVIALTWTAARRNRHYLRLRSILTDVQRDSVARPSGFATLQIPSFEQYFASIVDFLPADRFEELRSEAERLTGTERSYVPAHKKGGTIAYETLIQRAPAIVGLYHSEAMQRFVSRIVGVPVGPTPLHDQSSLSVLVYDRPGDHIGWHYDHNFYRGRHFTLLLPVVNTGSAAGGLSHAQLAAKLGGAETHVGTPPNTLILFEGAKVLHKVAPIIEGERRIVISMTYCTDPKANLAQTAARRLKDTAFYGIRALWT
jgi:hypothetical protein